MLVDTLSALANAFGLPVEERSRQEPAYPPITQFLFYESGATFDWLVKAFGLGVRLKVPGPGGVVVHGELSHGAGVIMVGAASAQYKCVTPKMAGLSTQGLYLMVDDADAPCAAAGAAGATIVSERANAHGHRRYTAVDPEGYHWMFASELG